MARFDTDLFISYAHIDNEPLTPEREGWISRFHAALDALLSMRLGRPAKIWRDDKLRGNDVFGDEIVGRFPHTAVLVSILTPRYLNSDWCTREIREFCERAAENGGVVAENNKARVFKILKTPVDTQESLPSVVKDILGYEFFRLEDETPLELDPAYGEEFAQDFNRKVGKLAWDVKELVNQLTVDAGAGGNGAADASAGAKTTIYLAECSYDQKEVRESLQGALQRLGYGILPDREMPREEAEYVAAAESFLSQSQLSVHLVGTSYGAVPDGPSGKSVVALQNEAAVRRSKSGALARVIWLPEGTGSEQESQRAFIQALHQDPETQFGADLIAGDIEALKTAIHTALKSLEERAPQEGGAADDSADRAELIYLICTEKDRQATISVRKYLRERGFDVSVPAFDGDASAVREVHMQLMSDCDAVVLFYGAGDQAWKRTMDNELRKIGAYRNGKPLRASFTYLAEPQTADKEDLVDMGEPHLINGFADSLETELSAFVEAVNGGSSA
jgi:hypothetical protein